MYSTIEDIEEWDGHHVRLSRSWFLAEELVQRYILESQSVSTINRPKFCLSWAYQARCPCSGACHADPQNSIGSQFTLIFGTVQILQKRINLFLVRVYPEPTLDQSRRNNLLYFLYCRLNTPSTINRRLSIPQLDSFIGTCRGTRRNKSAENAW